MQRSGILARVAHSLVLCGVPALALSTFGPGAWHTARSHAVAPYHPLATTAAIRLNHDAAADLLDWQETASPAMILVAEAHSVSAGNNKTVRKLRSVLKAQMPGSLDHTLTRQSLLLTAAQRDAWDANWRKMGRHGVDLRLLSRSLLNLRIEFLASNTSLQSLQAQQRAAGSVFSFTPPVF